MEKENKVKISKIEIKLSKLDLNSGQIEGIPANPRQWTNDDTERLAKSLEETPELLEMRCPIVIPNEGRYVVIGGNLRLAAARKLKLPAMSCYVVEDADLDKIREIVIKDNGAFGEWDIDALANEWDDLPLAEWGVDVDWNGDEQREKAEKDPEIEGEVKFTEVLGEEHNYVVLFFDNEVDWLQAQTLFGLESVNLLPTKRDGKQSRLFSERKGIGRVINGAEALNRIYDFSQGKKSEGEK